MQGRMEIEFKTEEKILSTLSELPDYVAEWYYNLKASKKTASSCNDYINKIRRFLKYIDDDIINISPERITLKKVQAYYISIQTKKINGKKEYTSDSYQQTVWCCLNNFLTFMVKTSRIPTNYMDLIDKPQNHDLERINENRILLTKRDFKDILNQIHQGAGSNKAKTFQKKTKERDVAIFQLFMTTGMRRTALSEINISDIDMWEQSLNVIDKGNKRHVYNLPDDVYTSINNWIEIRKNINGAEHTDALFITENGNRISGSAIYKLVTKYCDDALGYHVSPHKLRSGFCSILYEETGNVEFVRRAVGHSNISTTQRYIVTDNEERNKASELISSFIKM